MSDPWTTTKLQVLVWLVIAWVVGLTMASVFNVGRAVKALEAANEAHIACSLIYTDEVQESIRLREYLEQSVSANEELIELIDRSDANFWEVNALLDACQAGQ